MTKFFIFHDENLKKEFFEKIRICSKFSWKNLSKGLGISRHTLERYRSEGSKIRKDIFYKLLKYILDNDKNQFINAIKEVDSHEWLSDGGKRAYKINFKLFKEGRQKGIEAIKKSKKKKFRRIKKITLSFELSENLCEVIGAFIGDGFFNCYNNKLYQIEFAGDSRKDLEYYRDKIIPVLQSVVPELKPHIYFVRNKNSIRIVFYSKALFKFFEDGFGFSPGRKTYTVKIPEKIMSSNDNFINSTIRGIFDTDGGVFADRMKTYKKAYPRVYLQTASYPLYLQLKEYLSENFKIYAGKATTRDIYFLEIYGHNQLKKWMSIIGFSNPRHLNKVASIA